MLAGAAGQTNHHTAIFSYDNSAKVVRGPTYSLCLKLRFDATENCFNGPVHPTPAADEIAATRAAFLCSTASNNRLAKSFDQPLRTTLFRRLQYLQNPPWGKAAEVQILSPRPNSFKQVQPF